MPAGETTQTAFRFCYKAKTGPGYSSAARHLPGMGDALGSNSGTKKTEKEMTCPPRAGLHPIHPRVLCCHSAPWSSGSDKQINQGQEGSLSLQLHIRPWQWQAGHKCATRGYTGA